MSLFVTFEGVEGCGKTTQTRLLLEFFGSRGIKAVATREPGGCRIADSIRTILLDARNQELVPTAELLLYAAARAQHVAEVIRPALERGDVVVCDRFTDATIAYQGGGRGLERQLIDQLNEIACGPIHPNLTILLDLPPDVGLARAFGRMARLTAPREERFELESKEFHHRVREAYLALARTDSDRFVIVDAAGSPDAVHREIRARLLERFPWLDRKPNHPPAT